MRKLLFSLTKKDFKIDTFKSGGKGGQHQNKTDSGVRITHPESGAIGTARDSKSQNQNKKAAFNRCVGSNQFQRWLHKKVLEIEEGLTIEEAVDNMIKNDPIKIEAMEAGKWIIQQGMD